MNTNKKPSLNNHGHSHSHPRSPLRQPSFSFRKPSNVNSGGKKLPIEVGSSSPVSFFYMCLHFVAKRFVFAPIHVKIGVYMSTLVLCSLLKDFGMIHHNWYFSNKNNWLNQHLVKKGWAWTLAMCVPFIGMTSAVYTGFNVRGMLRHLSRLGVATLVWFVCTKLFDSIDTKTGRCAKLGISSKLECKMNKNEWIGFDISGHTFLIMYCLLIMLEEVKIFDQWDQYNRNVQEKIGSSKKMATLSPTSGSSVERAGYWFNTLTPFIKLNFILMAMVALMFEIMLLSTFLYYHTMMHKLIAAFFAIAAWFLTYRVWYVNKLLIVNPGLPGDDVV